LVRELDQLKASSAAAQAKQQKEVAILTERCETASAARKGLEEKAAATSADLARVRAN